jgi:hypothetical protein
MPRFVFGSRKKEELKKDDLVAPVSPADLKQSVKQDVVQEPGKIQLVTESMLLNAKLDHIIELLKTAMSD